MFKLLAICDLNRDLLIGNQWVGTSKQLIYLMARTGAPVAHLRRTHITPLKVKTDSTITIERPRALENAPARRRHLSSR
jgi:hypothetical protein